MPTDQSFIHSKHTKRPPEIRPCVQNACEFAATDEKKAFIENRPIEKRTQQVDRRQQQIPVCLDRRVQPRRQRRLTKSEKILQQNLQLGAQNTTPSFTQSSIQKATHHPILPTIGRWIDEIV